MNMHLDRRALLGGMVATAATGLIPRPGEARVSPARTAIQLPIPPRYQWEERKGYCGESCVQQAALLFGSYVSQHACRALIDPRQRRPFLVAMNDRRVLRLLQFDSAEFPYPDHRTPQFEPYLTWTKQHLAAGHPVLITAYGKYLRDPDYDHIMLATGFDAQQIDRHQDADVLVFNDCFSRDACHRTVASLSDDRRMRGNGRDHEFCIPTRVDFGCAITGIIDQSGDVRPVRLTLAMNREPNIMAGASPEQLDLVVTIEGLTTGTRYALYRYDDHRHVPTSGYASSRYDTVDTFVASGSTRETTTTVMSDRIVTFRCVPA